VQELQPHHVAGREIAVDEGCIERVAQVRYAMLALTVGAMASAVVATPAAAAGPARTGVVGTWAPAMPAPLAAPGVVPLAARKVNVKTTDRRPGGLLEADVTWSGKGPFRGRMFGTVQDLEPDGYCVIAYVWADGMSRLLPDRACPSGDAAGISYRFRRAWRVLVRVCLYSASKGARYCSSWR
jgi:hypothetical protein